MKVARRDGRPLVVGHRGAAALAPENTLESLAAAVEAGADVVEFDVWEGLVLAHSGDEVPARPAVLGEALALLAPRAVGLHVDLKAPGIEGEVAAALERHGLAERAYLSSTSAAALRRLRDAAPELVRAVGYPHDRHGAASLPWPELIVRGGAASLRAAMPLRAPLLLRSAGAAVLSVHHALVSRALVSTVHARGAGVVAWTANDPALVARLDAAGVDAIVSDDPAMAREALARLNPS